MPIENVPDSHKLEEHLSICRETNLYSKRVTMEKLTIEEINELPLTEKERKSNEAFATLAKVIKHYNDGWCRHLKTWDILYIRVSCSFGVGMRLTGRIAVSAMRPRITVSRTRMRPSGLALQSETLNYASL